MNHFTFGLIFDKCNNIVSDVLKYFGARKISSQMQTFENDYKWQNVPSIEKLDLTKLSNLVVNFISDFFSIEQKCFLTVEKCVDEIALFINFEDSDYKLSNQAVYMMEDITKIVIYFAINCKIYGAFCDSDADLFRGLAYLLDKPYSVYSALWITNPDKKSLNFYRAEWECDELKSEREGANSVILMENANK